MTNEPKGKVTDWVITTNGNFYVNKQWSSIKNPLSNDSILYTEKPFLRTKTFITHQDIGNHSFIGVTEISEIITHFINKNEEELISSCLKWLSLFGDLYGFHKLKGKVTYRKGSVQDDRLHLLNNTNDDSLNRSGYYINTIQFLQELLAIFTFKEIIINLWSSDTPNTWEEYPRTELVLNLSQEWIARERLPYDSTGKSDIEIQNDFLELSLKKYLSRHESRTYLKPSQVNDETYWKEENICTSLGDVYWAEFRQTILARQPITICQYGGCRNHFKRERPNQRYCPNDTCYDRAKSQRNYQKKRIQNAK